MPSICPSVDFATLTLATRAELGASVGTVDGGAGGVEGGTQALGDGAESFAFPHETLAGPKTTTSTPDEPLLQLPDVDGQASPKKSVRYHDLRNRLAPSWQLLIIAADEKETTANGPVIKQMLPEANMWRRWMPTRCGIHVVPIVSAAKFICHRLDHG